MTFDHGGETMKILHQIEGRLARGGADQPLDMVVARAHGARKLRKPWIGLDRNAAPAPEIEAEGDVVVDRMAGADVDVEAIAALAESAHQIEVFVALGVGDERHAQNVLFDQLMQPSSASKQRTAIATHTACSLPPCGGGLG